MYVCTYAWIWIYHLFIIHILPFCLSMYAWISNGRQISSARFFKQISNFNFIFYFFPMEPYHVTNMSKRSWQWHVNLQVNARNSQYLFITKSVPLFNTRIRNKTGKQALIQINLCNCEWVCVLCVVCVCLLFVVCVYVCVSLCLCSRACLCWGVCIWLCVCSYLSVGMLGVRMGICESRDERTLSPFVERIQYYILYLSSDTILLQDSALLWPFFFA